MIVEENNKRESDVGMLLQTIQTINEIALKCQEPSPAHMQMSTCTYLISM